MNKEVKNSPARIAANNRYAKKAYDKIYLAVHKGDRERIKAHAAERGLSLNAYIMGLVSADMGDALGSAPDEQDVTEE